MSYDKIAQSWAQVRRELEVDECRLVNILIEGVASDERVLDLGCGTGSPIDQYILTRGMQLTGVDQSENMLKIARHNIPNGEWLKSSIEAFRPSGVYAAAIAWDSIFHVPRQEHFKIFSRTRDALRSGGRFLLTVGGSEHPPFTGSMFGSLFFFDSFPPSTAVSFLELAGYKIIHTEFVDPPTEGRDKGRFAIVAEAV
ncbi:class I SAM-dependent methyltransferase [Burkholderia cepacia]|uniref:class I SAM-dependent methyltransferase n=1 Tax=Burkholderia cepacia TaxID=292 RepID=UPI0016396C7C|nr:class I SAM-dependent methyltransferase [Burkholderia cepacia]